MGIDFGKMIANLGITAAKMQKDTSKIDTKTELNTYVSGFDAIKAKAEADNTKAAEPSATTDIAALEAEMKSELAGLLGADFGKTAGVENKGTKEEPVFSEEDISLENMMALLEPEDGLNIDKLREENKKPVQSDIGAYSEMTDFGFDEELTNIIMEQTPGAAKYISDAIKSGSAKRITDDVAASEKDIKAGEEILKAIKKMNDIT